ncbi:insulinase family protein [Paractinoplanes durhamensis]|uniref:Zn-dependent peptidase n=1 Tax=Paractinoplanes durhamensis TaxID=113563 RepID=A0ABQ3Z2D5_9ACTN|nr:insulinase family protein [Actinoplanes durhamensis]GIE03975.1 hypothetical protein Adu01nite_53250 [Actinoplanes durhamensis]
MIKQLEVAGVPVLLAPTTGPAHAGLAFRVGFADEPLAKRGITHLIEHLALHSVGVADYHYNGATGVEFTRFHMQGAEADVVTFLNGVCAALRDLPMRRLEVEKEVLAAESHGRSAAVAEPMSLWRYGARDYGTIAYPEWGLPAITEDDLRAWVARYFTRENAVLWVAGDEVPAGLELDLPPGARQPAPAPSSALPVTPACFAGDSGLVVWDAVVPRSPAAYVYADVLERMLFRELRQESGLSYTAQTDYQPVGRDRVTILAMADAMPEKSGAVLGGMVDVLATLRAGRVDPADVTAVVNKQVEALRLAEEVGARLPGQALGLLAGRPVQDAGEQIAALHTVTAAEVAEVAAEAWRTGLMMSPGRADWAGFALAPQTSERAVTGTEFRYLGDSTSRLMVGPEGVSVVEEENLATVRYDECVLVRAWPDGGRQLVGADGIVVRVEPTLLKGGPAAVGRIDAAIPPGLRVDEPARNPGQIPKPRAKAGPAGTASHSDKVAGIMGLILWWPVTLVFGGLGALLFLSLLTDTEDLAYTLSVAVLCALVTALGVVGIRRSHHRMRYGARPPKRR